MSTNQQIMLKNLRGNKMNQGQTEQKENKHRFK
jgi:hypothetical protein